MKIHRSDRNTFDMVYVEQRMFVGRRKSQGWTARKVALDAPITQELVRQGPTGETILHDSAGRALCEYRWPR